MRIIFLNTFCGRFEDKLFEFIHRNQLETDIFCFQEVSVSLQNKLITKLEGFNNIFETGGVITDSGELSGQAVYFRDKFEISNTEKILLHELKTNDVGFLLKAEFSTAGGSFMLGNIHGTAYPGTKYDSDIRVNQSNTIIKSFENSLMPKIIGGDFNLLRNTKSIQMIEDIGYKNLIKDFGIVSTRNKITWELFKNSIGFVKQYDSDFVFVSPDLKIKSFEVPNVEVSDHEPLILDFDLP